MAAAPTDAGAAMRVVRALNRELQRQAREGGLTRYDDVDSNGQAQLAGTIDLAMVAFVTELVLRREFPSLGIST